MAVRFSNSLFATFFSSPLATRPNNGRKTTTEEQRLILFSCPPIHLVYVWIYLQEINCFFELHLNVKSGHVKCLAGGSTKNGHLTPCYLCFRFWASVGQY